MCPVPPALVKELALNTAGDQLGRILRDEMIVESPVDELEPYAIGDCLRLDLQNGGTIQVEIQQILSRSLSCVMLVTALSVCSLPKSMVLKLFDRRTSMGIRQAFGKNPWSVGLEKQFIAAIREGGLARVLDELAAKFHSYMALFERDWTGVDEIQLEAAVHTACFTLYDDESRAYELLKDLQGTQVPTLFGQVTMSSSSGSEDEIDIRLAPRGLLLEYINGFELNDLSDRMPPGTWQQICDAAMTAIASVRDHHVQHNDLHARNVIVRQHPSYNSFEAFVIDFGICAYADKFESQEEFELMQDTYDLGETKIADWMFARLEMMEPGAYTVRVSEKGQRLYNESIRRKCKSG